MTITCDHITQTVNGWGQTVYVYCDETPRYRLGGNRYCLDHVNINTVREIVTAYSQE